MRRTRLHHSLFALTTLPAAEWDTKTTSGGHMLYHKHVARHPSGKQLFTKTFDPRLFTDQTYASTSLAYLIKEHRVMLHLQSRHYPHVPEFIGMHEQTLAITHLPRADGWQWQVPKNTPETYIAAALTAFDKLTDISEKLDDTHSLTMLYDYGWKILQNNQRHQKTKLHIAHNRAKLKPFVTDGVSLLDTMLQKNMSATIDMHMQKYLQHNRTTFAHLDARQSNFAWHPTNGIVIIDWSWAALAPPNSDHTMLLIDLFKSGQQIDAYVKDYFNPEHALLMIGYWLGRSTEPTLARNASVRFHQLASAASAATLLHRAGFTLP